MSDAAQKTYDAIVVGGGSTGQNVADMVVRGGLSAVLIEAELVGGDCSYWACIPSKALLRGPKVLSEARAVRGAAAVTGELDVEETLAHRSSFTGDGDDGGQVKWVKDTGIDLLRGTGRLDGERTWSRSPGGTWTSARHRPGDLLVEFKLDLAAIDLDIELGGGRALDEVDLDVVRAHVPGWSPSSPRIA